MTHSTKHSCGDHVVDPNEGCDDGNTVSGDGCSETCTVETANPTCGNGIRETGEACDDGNTSAGDGCSASCQLEAVCGNGVVEHGEQCDDGNTATGDGCSSTCQTESATACGLLPQSGCSGATPACDLVDDNGTTGCRAVTSQGTSNNHCSVDTACKAGYTCVSTSDAPGTEAVCSRFCAVDGDCLGTGSRCVDGLVNSQGDDLHITVCSNACDVYGQTGCPSGMGCYGVDATAGDFTDCAYFTGHADGTACDSTLDCLAGSVCVDFGSGVTSCESYCVVGNNGTCATGTCESFTNPLTIGAVTYGFCN